MQVTSSPVDPRDTHREESWSTGLFGGPRTDIEEGNTAANTSRFTQSNLWQYLMRMKFGHDEVGDTLFFSLEHSRDMPVLYAQSFMLCLHEELLVNRLVHLMLLCPNMSEVS